MNSQSPELEDQFTLPTSPSLSSSYGEIEDSMMPDLFMSPTSSTPNLSLAEATDTESREAIFKSELPETEQSIQGSTPLISTTAQRTSDLDDKLAKYDKKSAKLNFLILDIKISKGHVKLNELKKEAGTLELNLGTVQEELQELKQKQATLVSDFEFREQQLQILEEGLRTIESKAAKSQSLENFTEAFEEEKKVLAFKQSMLEERFKIQKYRTFVHAKLEEVRMFEKDLEDAQATITRKETLIKVHIKKHDDLRTKLKVTWQVDGESSKDSIIKDLRSRLAQSEQTVVEQAVEITRFTKVKPDKVIKDKTSNPEKREKAVKRIQKAWSTEGDEAFSSWVLAESRLNSETNLIKVAIFAEQVKNVPNAIRLLNGEILQRLEAEPMKKPYLSPRDFDSALGRLKKRELGSILGSLKEIRYDYLAEFGLRYSSLGLLERAGKKNVKVLRAEGEDKQVSEDRQTRETEESTAISSQNTSISSVVSSTLKRKRSED